MENTTNLENLSDVFLIQVWKGASSHTVLADLRVACRKEYESRASGLIQYAANTMVDNGGFVVSTDNNTNPETFVVARNFSGEVGTMTLELLPCIVKQRIGVVIKGFLTESDEGVPCFTKYDIHTVIIKKLSEFCLSSLTKPTT